MAAVANLFKAPKIPEAPPAPTADKPAVQQAVSETAARRARARGYRATILSQMMDTVGSFGNVKPKDTFGA